MFYKMSILCMLLNIHKTCNNERTLNMRYSMDTFTMRLTEFNMCFKKTHVAHFSLYINMNTGNNASYYDALQ